MVTSKGKIALSLVVIMLFACGCGNNQKELSWIPQTDKTKTSDNLNVSIKETEENVPGNIETEELIKAEEDAGIRYINDKAYCNLGYVKKIVDVEQSGEKNEVLGYSTNYFDENGLLCIRESLELCEKENRCTVKKMYYILDNRVYLESKDYEVSQIIVTENGKKFIELEFLSNNFSLSYELNGEEVVLHTLAGVTDSHENTVYTPISFETQAGRFWTAVGTLQMVEHYIGKEYKNQFSCTAEDAYIPVEEGEQYRFEFYCSWFPEVGSILFLDENDKYVQSYSYNSSTYLKDEIIVVPKTAKKMHLTFYNSQTYQVEKAIKYIGIDLSQIDEEVYITQSQEIMKQNAMSSISNAHLNLDKAYVSFVLDDCRPDMDKIADIFEEYNIPLCIAAVSEAMIYPASNGDESRYEVCKRVVNNGGEVLAHDANVITQDNVNNFRIMCKQFYEDKQRLMQLGFPVEGIILAGGSGMIKDAEQSDMWVRNCYLYSDLYGKESKGEPYYHQRLWLMKFVDNYETVLQQAIGKHSWISFYFHDFSEVNEEQLREILDYISKIPKEQLEVANYKTIYDKFIK